MRNPADLPPFLRNTPDSKWKVFPAHEALWAARRAVPELALRNPWFTELIVDFASGAKTADDMVGTKVKNYWSSDPRRSLNTWYSSWQNRLNPDDAYPEWLASTHPEGMKLYRCVANVGRYFLVPWSTIRCAAIELVRSNAYRWDPIVSGEEPIHYMQSLTSPYDSSALGARHCLTSATVLAPEPLPRERGELADGPIEGDQVLPVEWEDEVGQGCLFEMAHVEAPRRSGRVKR